VMGDGFHTVCQTHMIRTWSFCRLYVFAFLVIALSKVPDNPWPKPCEGWRKIPCGQIIHPAKSKCWLRSSKEQFIRYSRRKIIVPYCPVRPRRTHFQPLVIAHDTTKILPKLPGDAFLTPMEDSGNHLRHVIEYIHLNPARELNMVSRLSIYQAVKAFIDARRIEGRTAKLAAHDEEYNHVTCCPLFVQRGYLGRRSKSSSDWRARSLISHTILFQCLDRNAGCAMLSAA